MDRRHFLLGAGSSCLLTQAPVLGSTLSSANASSLAHGRTVLESFDYRGVRLLPSRFLDQVNYARDVYFNLPNNDLLKGFRRESGLPDPGNDLRGWCGKDSGVTFGQWISGMARLSCATDDAALRSKAITLTEEWERTLGSGSNPRMDTYAWEKMSCGLVDLALYANYPRAMDILERITVWASKNFDRARSPATPLDRDGHRPNGTLEWYTLPENSYRAYLLTGNRTFLNFANLWTYDSYWNKFETTNRPDGVALLHSYSHVNTFSGAAMAYAVTGDARYLRILKNAYDWVRETQCYASGGYGPGEWSVPADGTLGRALDIRLDSAEIPCGSWAGFKISRYLMGFTGDARYGDWIETLLYNGIGAALPIKSDGRSFYYADYRIGMGAKTYFWDEWPCCSGTYIQAIADYHNVIYFKDESALYVNLLVPSEVDWQHHGQAISIRQETLYPVSDEATLRITSHSPAEFALKFRVPAWCNDCTFVINGQRIAVDAQPQHWAEIHRRWQSGDVVTVKFALTPYAVPVDSQQPRRVVVKYGPVMLAQDARFSYPLSGPGDDLSSRLTRDPDQLHFHVSGHSADREQQVGMFKPFYEFGEREPYRTYFDLDDPRFL